MTVLEATEEYWGVDWDIDDPIRQRYTYAVNERYITLRAAFYDSYSSDEEIDNKLMQSHMTKCDDRKAIALSNIPNTVGEISTYLDLYLPLPTSSVYVETSQVNKLHSNTRKTHDSNTEDESFFEKFGEEDEDEIEPVVSVRTVTLQSHVPYQPNRSRGMASLRAIYPDEDASVLIEKYKTIQKMCIDIMNELDKKHNPQAPKKTKMKYLVSGAVTTVKNNEYDIEFMRDKEWLDLRLLMTKIKKWAMYQYPQNWEEIYDQGLVKLVQMQKDHPGMRDSYYMAGIKRDAIDQWKKSQAQKRRPKEGFGELVEAAQYDTYPHQTDEWLDSLTQRQQQGLREAVAHWDTNGAESKVPESIKRKVRGVPGRTDSVVHESRDKVLLPDNASSFEESPVVIK